MNRSRLSVVPALARSFALLLCAVPLGGAARALPQHGIAKRAPFVDVEGTKKKWQFLTLTFHTAVRADESLHPAGQNPFLDYRLTVTFTHAASGTQYAVPGFFAADGNAAETGATAGNAWRAHFTPDHAGRWEWRAEFRSGPGIALDPVLAGTSADAFIDGARGWIGIQAADPLAPGFLSKGTLRYVGEHYFRFAETGEPYLKSGAGGPENFLAYYEFDGTSGDPGSQCLTGAQYPDHLHRYPSHLADFTGDAVDLQHLWHAGTRGHNVLGALNYLAGRGVNSLYFITNTYRGDGRDVWPWAAPLDKRHFDVSKLAQWERVFSHASHRGIQLQFVFEETENDQLSLAEGGLGYGLTLERELYYREMIARFAHHHAVLWVTGDESNYYDEVAAMESLGGAIRALDPYAHPIAFHGMHPCVGPPCEPEHPTVLNQYLPYFGSTVFDATVFQTTPGSYNNSTVQLRTGQLSSRKWAHHGDEQSLNAIPGNLDDNRKRALWGNLMGGGAGVAWYPGNDYPQQYPNGVELCDYFDLAVEDFRRFDGYFEDTALALDIFQLLPFTEMVPDNDLAAPRGPQDYVFHRPEDPEQSLKAIYAVYRGTGSATNLALGPGTHTVDWHDPRTGAGPLAAAPLVGPGAVPLTPPELDPGEDWVAIVRQE